MKLSLSILFVACLSFSLITQATEKIVKVPSIFNAGPTPIAVSIIKLKTNEIASLILLEGIASVASSAVLVSGCQTLEGKFPFEMTTDGSINKPEANFITVNSSKKSEPLTLNATIDEPDTFRGQQINIRQSKKSKLKETVISEYSSNATFNRDLTLLSMHSKVKVLGQNNIIGLYQNELLKHFYEDKKRDSKNQKIVGWGMASSSETNFPVNTFWTRYKAYKTNSKLEKMVIQYDRIVGASSCRIVIDGVTKIKKETKKDKVISFKGMMTISRAKPSEASSVD